jgi:molybdate transport system regulatory protein
MNDPKNNPSQPFHVKSKIWIEDSKGNVIFGLGRLRMLEAIERCGSLNAAAKELKMSYRGLWGKIKATEEGLGAPLLSRNTGGASGGGSQLTDLARALMVDFREMHTNVNRETDTLFNGMFAQKLKELS